MSEPVSEPTKDAAPPYHAGLPLWPDFYISMNEIDDLIPACRVESWRHFEEALTSDAHNRMSGEMVYRGQRDHRWPLSSTLSRRFGEGGIPRELASRLLNQFRLAMRGRGTDLTGMDDNEVWAYGQHYELWTPLLDWTKSPFVALYFSFNQPDVDEDGNSSRAIFCLNLSKLSELLPDVVLEPLHNENARLVNQAGLFIVTPLGSENFISNIFNELETSGAVDMENPNEIARYINKIHIPNENRDECLGMLRKMNIHHANLFPDPGGASRYSNDWLSRVIAERARDERMLRESERAARSKEAVSAISAKSGDATNFVKELLLGILVGEASVSDSTLQEWSQKIDEKYDEVASIDWPNRPSGSAKVKVELGRLLSVLDYPSALRDQTLDVLLQFYRSRYQVSE